MDCDAINTTYYDEGTEQIRSCTVACGDESLCKKDKPTDIEICLEHCAGENGDWDNVQG